MLAEDGMAVQRSVSKISTEASMKNHSQDEMINYVGCAIVNLQQNLIANLTFFVANIDSQSSFSVWNE